MEKNPRESKSESKLELKRHRWASAPLLQIVHGLNEQCLELGSRIAASNNAGAGLDITHRLKDLWLNLDASARRRAATVPILLAELHFHRLDWWEAVRRSSQSAPISRQNEDSVFAKHAQDLVRDILMQVWRISQSHPRSASIIFGITPEVTASIAALKPADLIRIADTHSRQIRLRWETKLGFWNRLLRAAIHADQKGMADVHCYSQLLIGRERISVT